MSHTKEPWCLSGLTHACFIAQHTEDDDCEEHPVIWGKGGEDLEGSREDLLRAVACVNACAGLPEPEKNIRELVEAARGVEESISRTMQSMACWKNVTRLKQALKPFKEKK